MPEQTPIFVADENSRLPVWIQLRNRLIFLIKRGDYAPGDQLPSVRSLAVSASINYNTVSKVYGDLEDSGYVRSVRGKGVFVTERTLNKDQAEDTREVAETEIKDCIRRCLLMGMSLDEVKLAMMDAAMKIQYEGRNEGRFS